MNGTELDAAIEQANRIFSKGYQPGYESDSVSRRPSPSSPSDPWPSVSLDAERRFGQPHAKLFLFIGRKVRTPAGAGTLLQVFAKRVTVLLESDMDKCAFFEPAEIEPVSWEL